MVVWTSYRTARTCWLREGGDLVDQAGAPADPRRARLIALSRGLCRFEFYAPPAGMSGAGALRAARLRAEAFAPFTVADTALLRSREGVAIWWWDADRARALLATAGIAYDPARVAPETLLQAPAEGWRQVRCADGYEAQYWRAGALRATSWRRRPFSAEQWVAFAQTLDAAEPPAPIAPPPSLDAVVQPSRARALVRADPLAGWPRVERWAAAVTVGAAALGACFTAQSIYYQRQEAAALARAELYRAGRAGPAAVRAMADLALIRGFQAHAAAATPLLAAADAFRVCRDFGLEPTSWSVDGRGLTMRLAASDPDALAELAAALEAEPTLRAVVLKSDGTGEAVTLSADLAGVHG